MYKYTHTYKAVDLYFFFSCFVFFPSQFSAKGSTQVGKTEEPIRTAINSHFFYERSMRKAINGNNVSEHQTTPLCTVNFSVNSLCLESSKQTTGYFLSAYFYLAEISLQGRSRLYLYLLDQLNFQLSFSQFSSPGLINR